MHNPEGHSPKYWRRHPPVTADVHEDRTHNEPHWKDAFKWLWRKLFTWPVVGGIALTFGGGVAGWAVQEHMYVLADCLIGFVTVLIFFKTWEEIQKSHLKSEAKRAAVILTAVLFLLLGNGALWIVHFRKQSYLDELPRADLHVDDVTVEIKDFHSLGMIGAASSLPAAIYTHISGHNQSPSTPTAPYPMVQASISLRPFITEDHLDEEEALFTDGAWANASYVGWPYVLNPEQQFSLEKQMHLTLVDAKGVTKTGNPFTDNWNALEHGEVVIYVVTRTKYRDKWGAVPEERTCSVFAANDGFRRHTCSGQFKIGTYQP